MNYLNIINSNEEVFEAKLISSDVYSDIAVLTVDKNAVDSIATLSSSTTLELGDIVFTVGTPLGVEYQGSITKGIVSGLNRLIPVDENNETVIIDAIQTDAAINPGNSGGPLCDINGNVIGVNSLKLVEDEIEGMGFAIPIDEVIKILPELESGSEVNRPYLGISIIDVKQGIALNNNLIDYSKYNYGVIVSNVEEGSLSAINEIVVGDLILELNNEKIDNSSDFKNILYQYYNDDIIELLIIRNNKEFILNINL